MSKSQKVHALLWSLLALPVGAFLITLYLALHQTLVTGQPADPNLIFSVTLVLGSGLAILIGIFGLIYIFGASRPRRLPAKDAWLHSLAPARWQAVLISVYVTVFFLGYFFLTHNAVVHGLLLPDLVAGAGSVRLLVLAGMDGILIGALIGILINFMDSKAVRFTLAGAVRFIMLRTYAGSIEIEG